MRNEPSESPFDREAALIVADGDEEFLADVMSLFLADALGRMKEIEHAVQQRDAKRLEAAAHALKGSAGCLSAEPTMAAALHLEKIGRSGDLSDAVVAFAGLEQEMTCLMNALSTDA
jgi:HPt (histidine-containing phosphotransfer) domain-containing protein